MATMLAYEVQTYEGGSWQIASMYDDKETALFEARRLEEGIRRRETRVVEEVHDEESGRSRSKIIYKTPKIRPDQAPATAQRSQTQPQSQAKAPAGGADWEDNRKNRRPRPVVEKKQPNMILVGLMFFLIVGVGVAALIALRQMSMAG